MYHVEVSHIQRETFVGKNWKAIVVTLSRGEMWIFSL